MNIDNNTPVGKIATKYPLATRVFSRHKIDFCCGGGISLEEVCLKKGLVLLNIINELNGEIEQSSKKSTRSWQEASAQELIDHILKTYHRPLDEELPRLTMMATKVYNVHKDKDPSLQELLSTINGLRAELEQHMIKEEQILFPAILQGRGAQAGGPINQMEHEHENAGNALKKIRELTNNFVLREDACNTWRALWHGLETLEAELHQHIHLENNILFPKALGIN